MVVLLTMGVLAQALSSQAALAVASRVAYEDKRVCADGPVEPKDVSEGEDSPEGEAAGIDHDSWARPSSSATPSNRATAPIAWQSRRQATRPVLRPARPGPFLTGGRSLRIWIVSLSC